jgi:hypothetical protein
VQTGKLLRVSEASVVIDVDRKPKEVQVHRIREMEYSLAPAWVFSFLHSSREQSIRASRAKLQHF